MIKHLLFRVFILGILFLLYGCGGSSSENAPFEGATPSEQARAKQSYRELFVQIDLDQDNVITRDEFLSAMAQQFEQLDSDNDDTLEQSDADDDPLSSYSISGDQDGNDESSFEEYAAYYEDIFFTELDLQGDQELTLPEFLSAFGLSQTGRN